MPLSRRNSLGTSETEAIHTRPTRLPSLHLRPRRERRRHAKPIDERPDLWIQALQQQIRRHGAVLQREGRFEDRGDAGRPLAVSQHRLDAADQELGGLVMLRLRPWKEGRVDGLGLDGVARGRACPVGLKVLRPVVGAGWVETGPAICLPDQGSLGFWTRPVRRDWSAWVHVRSWWLVLHRDTTSLAVLVGSRFSDDGLNMVAITDSIAQSLEHQRCDSLASCISISTRICRSTVSVSE